jgi:hypothetical protein
MDMAGTEKISPKELSRIFVESYQEAGNVDEFAEKVTARSGILMLRYFLAAIYYALDMVAIG